MSGSLQVIGKTEAFHFVIVFYNNYTFSNLILLVRISSLANTHTLILYINESVLGGLH